jgi:aspartate beta-hydroxylase
VSQLKQRYTTEVIPALKSEFGYTNAMQLPTSFVRGLRAAPWHAAAEGSAAARLEALLEQAHVSLREEARALDARGAIASQEECIQDGGANRRWAFLNVNKQRGEGGGCASEEAPAACALLAAAARAGVPVLRGAYSVLRPGAHLHPHCGVSNAHLKMHLGLDAPVSAATGEGCARIRVGNETRRWAEGRVLHFDDSFEHEVYNDCREEGAVRSVFQVVFEHPDLARVRASGGEL